MHPINSNARSLARNARIPRPALTDRRPGILLLQAREAKTQICKRVYIHDGTKSGELSPGRVRSHAKAKMRAARQPGTLTRWCVEALKVALGKSEATFTFI